MSKNKITVLQAHTKKKRGPKTDPAPAKKNIKHNIYFLCL